MLITLNGWEKDAHNHFAYFLPLMGGLTELSKEISICSNELCYFNSADIGPLIVTVDITKMSEDQLGLADRIGKLFRNFYDGLNSNRPVEVVVRMSRIHQSWKG